MRNQNLQALVKKIQALHNTLCDVPKFINEFQHFFQKIELDLNSSGALASQNTGSSAMNYNKLLCA